MHYFYNSPIFLHHNFHNHTFNWDALSAIGTILAVFAAVLVPIWMDYRQKRGLRSRLSVLNVKIFNQSRGGNSHNYGRLLIKNLQGAYKASSVEATVVSIFENDVDRRNFLSVPLKWTGSWVGNSGTWKDRPVRDINPDQAVYLDVFEYKSDNKNCELILSSLVSGLGIDSFTQLKAGLTQLVINLYQESGQTLTIKISINWDGVNCPKDNDVSLI